MLKIKSEKKTLKRLIENGWKNRCLYSQNYYWQVASVLMLLLLLLLPLLHAMYVCFFFFICIVFIFCFVQFLICYCWWNLLFFFCLNLFSHLQSREDEVFFFLLALSLSWTLAFSFLVVIFYFRSSNKGIFKLRIRC